MNRDLFDKAKAVRDRAHAPYSKFHVGAAILSEAGKVHVGANVENASYPEGCCAETSAISAMVAASEPGPATPVHVIDPSGEGKTWRMDELLPAAFAMDETT